ncbi:MAG: hypothetical protein RSC68_01400 [Acinetobacter sp.]
MNFQANVQVGALFKLIVHKGNPEQPSKETPMFHNLVLDAGLDRLSVGSAIDRVCVGSGNSAPIISQTKLDAFVASTTTTQGYEVGIRQVTTEPYYYGGRIIYRFGEGVAAGNLSELGLGWANTNLFNRALIKDANGNPTTITVLADEFLDVVVEIRVYPQRSFTGSFNLLDKLGAVISTHSVDGSCLIGVDGSFQLGGPVSLGDWGSNALLVYSGNRGDSVIQDPLTYIGSSSGIVKTYPTPRSCKGVANFGLTVANGIHQSFRVAVQFLGSRYISTLGYKWQITPPIQKNNKQEIQYSFTLNWDRYTP